MYTVIFAGGQGTRISEETNKTPKPMIKLDSKPILEHIINIYIKYGLNKFIVLTGYKSKNFYKYFKGKKNYFVCDTKIKNKKNLEKFNFLKEKNKIYLNLFYSGLNSNKRERLAKISDILKNEKDFFLTYGDGVSDLNIKKLLRFHKNHKKICTLTGVNPKPRYGLLELSGSNVLSFKEKKKIRSSFVNAGFFVCKTNIFKYLNKQGQDFEENVLSYLSRKKELKCFKHSGFWQCMDTLRDKNYLKKLIKNKNAPWI